LCTRNRFIEKCHFEADLVEAAEVQETEEVLEAEEEGTEGVGGAEADFQVRLTVGAKRLSKNSI